MTAKDALIQLADAARYALDATLSDAECAPEVDQAYMRPTEWEQWVGLLRFRGEDTTVLEWSLQEYEFALYLASTGHYRNAFSELRLFLELGCISIHFANNEVDRRKWIQGEFDLEWRKLNDEKSGLFSPDYAKVFFPELADQIGTYRGLARETYRECSQYVHGNAVTHAELEGKIQFNKGIFLEWCKTASYVNDVLIFAFVVRFLKDMCVEDRVKVRDSVLKRFSTVAVIAALFPA